MTTSITAFILIVSIFCLIMGIIWKKTDWINIFAKLVFVGLSIWGIIIWLNLIGIIIKQ